MGKICSKCRTEKDLNAFSLRNDTNPPRRRSHCKACSAYYTNCYRIKNPEKSKNSYSYEKKRMETDINFKLTKRLRIRLLRAIESNYKTGSAIRDLGCSIDELKKHLENQFKEGMSWANYGKWHIDHIKSLSSFDLTNNDELKQACHYTNLQPLWAVDNIRKGNK